MNNIICAIRDKVSVATSEEDKRSRCIWEHHGAIDKRNLFKGRWYDMQANVYIYIIYCRCLNVPLIVLKKGCSSVPGTQGEVCQEGLVKW